MLNMFSETTLRGVVVDIIYENSDNGFKICELETEDDIVVIKGILPFVQIGEHICVTGKWICHDIYGEQFDVDSFEKELPKDPEDMEAFLASGLISGVGNATAKLIVGAYGQDTYHILLHEPERLAELKGITHNKAMKISAAFKEHYQMSDVIMFFNKYGIGSKLAIKAYQKYGEVARNVVEKNPYIMIDDIPEIGFKTADKIGRSIGISFDSSERIYAGITHVLKQGMQYGHVFLPLETIVFECTQLLEIEDSKIIPAIDEMDILGKITISEDENRGKIAYLPYMYACENYIAKRLLELKDDTRDVDENNFNDSVNQFYGFTGYQLDENQIAAVKTACANGVTVITGGPGTGKTTIIRALVHFMMSNNKKCLLAAPTGRAAKRMTESCGMQAKTIHRLLEFSGDESSDDSKLRFKRDESNPLEADVVIIDELSMVDTLLMYHFLKAIPHGVQLVLVGDKDQLPSVGAGNVLRDLIASDVFTTVTLSVIYRQNTKSLITVNAHKINNGEMPELNAKDGDFFIIKRQTPDSCAQAVVELCTKRLPDAYNIDPMKDIQVLIPSRKGTVGSINTNILLQKVLNPDDGYKKQIVFEDVTYREGDRIMQIKNNYNIKWYKKDNPEFDGEGIFNGEMGEIYYINTKARELVVLFDDNRCATYNFNELRQLEHCYAITVHKSQGSEFPYCIIPIVGNPPMLMTRNILYTAITRAKKMVVIVGTTEDIRYMTENNKQLHRYTGLCKRIKEYVED